MYIFCQFRRIIWRKAENSFVNIIEKYRSRRGGGRYLAGKTSAAAAAYTTIYTHRLTLLSFNIVIISCFIATLL